jgi:hypothetical protein
MNIVTCDTTIARETRLRLWAEHLERSVEEVSGEPVGVIDNLWRPIAGEQLARRKRGEPLTHRLLELPGVSRPRWGCLDPWTACLSTGEVWPVEVCDPRRSLLSAPNGLLAT